MHRYMKTIFIFVIYLFGMTGVVLLGQDRGHSLVESRYRLGSPDGKIEMTVEIGEVLHWSLTMEGKVVFMTSPLSLELENGEVWGKMPQLKKAIRKSADSVIGSPFYKKTEVQDRYNQLELIFKGDWSVVFRAYDDGVAYRFRYLGNRPFQVKHEQVSFCFDEDYSAIVPYVRARVGGKSVENQFYSAFENIYVKENLSHLDREKLMFLPLVVDLKDGKKVLITEADLESYPGMYLRAGSENTLHGVFAPYPRQTVQGGHNMLQRIVTAREPYIARVSGKRDFPWRILVISREDGQLADCDMVYRLAAPSRIEDISWIKPGKVAWEWWNDWNIEGVDFESGINNNTYKYYIDFAAKNDLEYVILDEGWAVNLKADLMQVVPEIDLPELIEYAGDRSVGLILWAGYEALNKDMENICRHYAGMGIKGFKIDFMDRDDQDMVDFIYRACETAGRYRLLLDLHGMYKPTGLQRTYPNVLNCEGVHGLENMKWSASSVDQVTYDVTLPFIRMAAGPVDYTQGAMRNAAKGTYAPIYSDPMSQGTRCRQLAQYVIFESPLTMLCDSPNNYEDEQECLNFIAQVPVVWDDTRVLEADLGSKIVTARRKGGDWYVGGMTGWEPAEANLDFSFIGEGDYKVTVFRDGKNANRRGTDYRKEVLSLPKNRKLCVKMAPGGGFALVIQKIK